MPAMNAVSWKRYHLNSAKNWFGCADNCSNKRDRKFYEREGWHDLLHWASGL